MTTTIPPLSFPNAPIHTLNEQEHWESHLLLGSENDSLCFFFAFVGIGYFGQKESNSPTYQTDWTNSGKLKANTITTPSH